MVRTFYKQFVDVAVGVVDPNYVSEVGVVLFNHADDNFCVCQRDRIPQRIRETIKTPAIEVVDNLNDTSRGSNWFWDY